MGKTISLIFICILIAYFWIFVFTTGIFRRGKLKKLIKQHIGQLRLDVLYFENELKIWPEDSFVYAFRNLGLEVTKLKIEMWKSFLTTIGKFEKIKIG